MSPKKSQSESRRLTSLTSGSTTLTFTLSPKTNARHVVAVLKQLLKGAGLSHPELSALTGIPKRTIQSWFSGQAVPPPERIEAVKTALRAEAASARSLADAITKAFGV